MLEPHLSEWQLVALASGTLTPNEADLLRSHLECCPACQVALDAQVRLWHALDADRSSAEASAADPTRMADRVLAAWQARRVDRPSMRLPMIVRPALLRWAAAIALGSTLGWLAAPSGLLTPPGEEPVVTDAEAAAALYLDDLWAPAATDLAGLVEEVRS